MNQKEIRTKNKEYLQLNDEQLDRHEELMSCAMSGWPDPLFQFMKRVFDRHMMSGDVIACGVADYVRGDNRLTGVDL